MDKGVDKVTLQPLSEEAKKLHGAAWAGEKSPSKNPAPIDEDNHWANYKERITGVKSESPTGFDWTTMKKKKTPIETPEIQHQAPMATTEEMLSLKKSLNQLRLEG